MYRTLSLHDFRSYHEYTAELSPAVTIVVGPNGSGKTNLLEALYVLSRGTSFRAADRHLVRAEAGFFRLEGRYNDQLRVLTYAPTQTPTKTFKFDSVSKQRLSYQERLPVVLFEPDDLRLLSGSPQRRRDYLDSLQIRLWPDATRVKNQFERTLLQRNHVLKQAHDRSAAALEDLLFVWDVKLAEYAGRLRARRLELVGYANERLGEIYSQLAGRESQVRVRYESELPTHDIDYTARLLHELNARAKRDIQRGFTSAGPHRDDFALELDAADAATSASRGELRTLVLALKLIELQLLDEHTPHPPLLLLDDVFSELDASRRAALAKQTARYQTIITTTDADTITSHLREASIIAIGGITGQV